MSQIDLEEALLVLNILVNFHWATFLRPFAENCFIV